MVQRWWRPAHGHRGGFQLPGSSLLCLTTTSQRREREVPPASSHPPPPPPPPPFPSPPTSSQSPFLLPPNLSLFFLLLLSASRMQQQRTRDQARGRTWTRSSKGMRKNYRQLWANKCYIPRHPNPTHCFPCELYLFCDLVYFVFSLYLYSSYRVILINCLPPHPPSSCRAKYIFVTYWVKCRIGWLYSDYSVYSVYSIYSVYSVLHLEFHFHF